MFKTDQSMNIDEKDRRGYTQIHRAFECGRWTDIKKLVDRGARIDVIAPSGASLKDFAGGLKRAGLYTRLVRYLKSMV